MLERDSLIIEAAVKVFFHYGVKRATMNDIASEAGVSRQTLYDAEVELASEEEGVDLPAWVINEVTGEVKYYNTSLLDNPFSQWE